MAPPLPDVVKYNFVPSWLTEQLLTVPEGVLENTEATVAVDSAVGLVPVCALPLVDR